MKLFLSFALFALVAACDRSPTPNRVYATIDTVGGIVHVSNPAPVRIDTAAVLISLGSIGGGGTPNPEEFGRINALALDSAGNLLVAEGQVPEIRVFSPTGGFVRRIGGPGQGPGEFPSLYSLGWVGDTLFTLELARLSVFENGDRFRQHHPWIPFTGPSNVVRFYTTGHEEVYVLGRMPSGIPGRSFIRFNAEGSQDTLRIADDGSEPVSSLVCPHSNGILSIFTIPFASHRIVTPAPAGRILVADSESYRIILRSDGGDTLRVIQRSYSPLPIGDTEWADATREYEEFRKDNPGVQCDPAGMRRAETKPALQGLYFGYEGQMIVEVTAEGASRYDFFDADGVAYATVLAPERDQSVVPVVRGGRLAQVVRDSLDIQHVQIFRIPQPASPEDTPGA